MVSRFWFRKFRSHGEPLVAMSHCCCGSFAFLSESPAYPLSVLLIISTCVPAPDTASCSSLAIGLGRMPTRRCAVLPASVSAVPVNVKLAFVVVPVAVANKTPFVTLFLAPEIATHALPVQTCHSPRVELKQTDSPVVGLLICEQVARMNGTPDWPRSAGGRSSSVSRPTTLSAASPQRLISASSPSPGPAPLRARTSAPDAAAR